jgi:hypothetical protein
MSRCYFVKSEDPINLEALTDMIQDKLKNGLRGFSGLPDFCYNRNE